MVQWSCGYFAESNASINADERTRRVIGYIRVSTDEQRESGAGLAAQRAAILSECERRGWHLVEIAEDPGFSAKDLKRPGVKAALELLRKGGADALVVAKLDRLSRSMLDFSGLMATAQRQGWAVVALDAAVDTTTAAGEALVHVLATFAQFERRLISQRTREALAEKRAQGVRLGRPPQLPNPVRARIKREFGHGKTMAAIARELNADGVPTAQGGRQWWPSTIRAVLRDAHDHESAQGS